MKKEELLSESKQVVKRLILQYEEYSRILDKIKKAEQQELLEVSRVSKELGKSPTELLHGNHNDSSLQIIRRRIELLKIDLQQLSDEMTFANPLIWMMYKFEAYKGKSNEISNMRQFRNHCMPEGYICTERYRFLNSYLHKIHDVDLNDIKEYPDNYKLNDLYSSDLITSICNDLNFMKKWKQNEYRKTEGKVNKWNTVIVNI